MPFYSAIAEIDIVRKTDALENQGDPSRWLVVPVTAAVALHFELLNPQSSEIGKIISALTESPVYHVETFIADTVAADEIIELAESRLGQPYDLEGALRAWNDSGYHTPRKEFCSGLAYEILSLVLQGLQPYPNPWRLLHQVTGMLGLPAPKLSAAGAAVGDAELQYLDSLSPDRVATGVVQEIMARLQGAAPA
jgi:hypothetical protein